MDSGLPFHLSRANALKDYLNSNKLLDTISNSNNILGIEYIKSLIRLNSAIVPKTIKREGSLYNDVNISASFASATSIRKHLKEKSLNDLADIMPTASYDILLSLSSSKLSFYF